MDFELAQPSIFPNTTVLKAYPAAAVPDRTKAPVGASVAEDTVENGKAVFSGLDADASYYAGAEVSEGVWRYVHFTPGTPGSDVIASTDADETVEGKWTVADVVTLEDDLAVEGALVVDGQAELNGDLNHDGTKVGFFGTAPAAQPDLKPAAEVTAKELGEALVTLGLIK